MQTIIESLPPNTGSSRLAKSASGRTLIVRLRGGFMHRRRIIVGVFVLMFGLFPLLNAIGNPRVQTLHGSDVAALIAAGLCFGFGLGLLLSKPMFRDE